MSEFPLCSRMPKLFKRLVALEQSFGNLATLLSTKRERERFG